MSHMRAIRLSLDITQAEMSKILDISPGLYNSYECNRLPVSLRVAKRFAKFAQENGHAISLDKLLDDSSSEQIDKCINVIEYAKSLGVNIRLEQIYECVN